MSDALLAALAETNAHLARIAEALTRLAACTRAIVPQDDVAVPRFFGARESS